QASGTQLIQELTYEGLYVIKKYKPTMDKVMRLFAPVLRTALSTYPRRPCGLTATFMSLSPSPEVSLTTKWTPPHKLWIGLSSASLDQQLNLARLAFEV